MSGSLKASARTLLEISDPHLHKNVILKDQCGIWTCYKCFVLDAFPLDNLLVSWRFLSEDNKTASSVGRRIVISLGTRRYCNRWRRGGSYSFLLANVYALLQQHNRGSRVLAVFNGQSGKWLSVANRCTRERIVGSVILVFLSLWHRTVVWQVANSSSQAHKASFNLNKGAVCLRPITTTQTGTAKRDVTLWIFTTEDLGTNGKLILKWISSRFEGRGLDWSGSG